MEEEAVEIFDYSKEIGENGLIDFTREDIDEEKPDIEDDEMCCICLDNVELDTQGFLTKCVHIFHFDCISQWAKVTNLCPMCKTRFRSIVKKDIQGTVISSLEVKNITQGQQDDPRQELSANANLFNEYACMLCGNGDNEEVLLICDATNCENAAHTYCIPIPSVPNGYWYCPEHSSRAPPRRSLTRPATTLATMRNSRRTRRSTRIPTRRISQLEARIGVRRGQRLPLPFENEVARYQSGQTRRRGAVQSAAARDMNRMHDEAARIMECVNRAASSSVTPSQPKVKPLQPAETSRETVIRKRRIEEIQAVQASFTTTQQSKRPVKRSTNFEGEYNALRQQMHEAQVKDTSTLLPTASKLRLLPTVKRFFEGLNEYQKKQALDFGVLKVFKLWIEPYDRNRNQHPQVLEALVNILTQLPIEKPHLKESDGLGRVVTQLCSSKQLNVLAQSAATQLLGKWSEFARKPSEEETKATSAPKRSASVVPMDHKPPVVEYVKSQLYPAYHRGILSKDKFKQVAKHVCHTFLYETTMMSTSVLTSDGILSPIAKTRLNYLIDAATT